MQIVRVQLSFVHWAAAAGGADAGARLPPPQRTFHHIAILSTISVVGILALVVVVLVSLGLNSSNVRVNEKVRENNRRNRDGWGGGLTKTPKPGRPLARPRALLHLAMEQRQQHHLR